MRRSLRSLLPVLTPLAAACVHAQAQAQTAPAEPVPQVVVTGSPVAVRTLDAPYAISVIEADALRAAGPLIQLSEALARVPGLVVRNRSNDAQDLQISARGFGARAGFGVRGLRIYADGIPATMPDGQGQVAHLDLAGAERIEVLRGPFSALYGHSSGGVIALFTAPAKRDEAEAAVDAGSFGLRQGRLGAAARIGDTVDVRVNAAVVDNEGFRPQSASNRRLANLRLGWQFGDDRLLLLVSDHRQRADDPLGLTRAQFDADPRSTAPQALQFDTRKTIEQTQAGLQWQHRFRGETLRDGRLVVYNGTREVTQWLAIPPATQAGARHGGGVVDFARDYRGIDGRLTWRVADADVVSGVTVETQDDARRGYNNFTGPSNAPLQLGTTGSLRRDERNRADTREAYLQASASPAEHWGWSAGVRSGRARLRADDRFLGNGDDSGQLSYRYTNPVAGLRWTVRPGWTLHAGAARGFESPTLGELAYRPDGAGGFNTALKGQASRQLELGSKVRGRGFSFDAALFAIDTRDEIGVMTNLGGRSSFQNTGRTRRHGAEVAVGWQALPTVNLQLAASVLRARYRDGFLTCAGTPCSAPTLAVPEGNRIPGAPEATAYAELAWTPAIGLGEFAMEWRATGRTAVNDANTEFAAGHALASLRWRHTVQLGGADALELMLRAENLFDRRYVGSVIVNDGNGRFLEPGAPRSVLMSMRWKHTF
jgi:iron complex outermembrane receptor protein